MSRVVVRMVGTFALTIVAALAVSVVQPADPAPADPAPPAAAPPATTPPAAPPPPVPATPTEAEPELDAEGMVDLPVVDAPPPVQPPAPKKITKSKLQRLTHADTESADDTAPDADIVQIPAAELQKLLRQTDVEPSPTPIISGPSAVCVGDMVVLSAEGSLNVKSYSWLLIPDTAQVQVVNNGRSLLFTNRKPGNYVVILSVASADGRIASKMHTVTLSRGPDSDEEDEAAPAAKAVAQAMRRQDYRRLARSMAGSVKGVNKDSERAAMASAFRTSLGMLQTGNITSREELVRATATFAQKGLGSGFSSWESFLLQLGEALNVESGDLERMRVIWTDVATGLEDKGT